MPARKVKLTQKSWPLAQKWDPRTKRYVPCPGGKIRSRGAGRGAGRGKGKGPIEIPYKRKK